MKKILSFLLTCVLVFSMSMPVFAEGYIVRTTVETVETTNGVVTGYSKEVYDSPVQYGTPPAPAATQCQTTQPATTATVCASSNSGGWTPNWGANYAAQQAMYMNSGKKSTENCWKPNYNRPTYSYDYATIGDEARAKAADIRSYAEARGWSVSISGDWGDCNYRNIEITVSNKNHARTWLQKTILTNGCYQTHYERDGHNEWADDVKWYIKDRAE